MAKLDFTPLNKAAAKSFNDQRNLIKRIGRGETVPCQVCQQVLTLSVLSNARPGVSCKNGCTDINLELEGSTHLA